MIDDYSTPQLIELRNVCLEMVERAPNTKASADALLLLEQIDEVLASREQQQKSA